MKRRFVLMGCVVISIFSISNVYSQVNRPELARGNYVVVGVYLPGDEACMDFFVKSIQAKGLNPKTGFETERNFYYVYLHVYQDFAESIKAMEKTRQIQGLENAWVRVIKDENSANTKKIDTDQSSVKTQPEIISQNEPKEIAVEKTNDEPFRDSVLIDQTTNSLPPTITPSILEISNLKNTEVFISLYDPIYDKVIPGEVEVIDAEQAKLVGKVKGNTYLNLVDPTSTTGRLTLICDVFGYRKTQHHVTFPKPILDEEAELFGNFYVIKFEMVRYRRGDITILYNVYFYNDAAIMLPESKYELNRLLEMMNENPNLKIVLHGHTNGSARGKIITMGSSKNFFTLGEDVKTSYGSSKELSNQRAITIREWLLANKVDPNRVDVKPWGGKRMVHDKHGVHAKKNIRVEVEVVED